MSILHGKGKGKMLPRYYKVSACFTMIVAVAFYLFFFQGYKQQPALASVTPFADDPYDAVGSFGIQLTWLMALLSLVRAFRHYQPGQDLMSQELLFIRGAYASCLSVAVTLAADIVALLRHPSVWIGLPEGNLLVAQLGGMVLLTALLGWFLHRGVPSSFSPKVWARAIGISLVNILLLAFYPEAWHQSVPGELLTICVGMVFLFVPTWAITTTICPVPDTFFEDCIDDLTSLYRWLRAHLRYFAVFFTIGEKVFGLSFMRSIVNWLNPRKHPWHGIFLFGVCIALLFFFAEGVAEGGGNGYSLQQVITLLAVSVGVESAGVVLGYALLAKPLGLFRTDSVEKRKDHSSPA